MIEKIMRESSSDSCNDQKFFDRLKSFAEEVVKLVTHGCCECDLDDGGEECKIRAKELGLDFDNDLNG